MLRTIVVGFVGWLLGLSVLTFAGAVVTGCVVSTLWGWFLVPTLGVPKISAAQAIGIVLIARLVTFQAGSPKGESDKSEEGFTWLIGTAIRELLPPILVLLWGWVVWQFV